MTANQKDGGTKLIAQNKAAWHEYYIDESVEAGIVLCGTEVKSVRLGNVTLKESYVQVQNGEVYIQGMHISPYEKGNIFNKEPLRPRKLLLHKSEIRRLQAEVKQNGMTLVPLKIYFRGGKIKMEVGIAKGKKLFDKRASKAEKDVRRDIERRMKGDAKASD
jgi:SsrA-binding protein